MKRSFKKFEQSLRDRKLYNAVEKRSHGAHVTLRDLYEGPVTASIVDARRVVYKWLVSEGKSINEVARLFDRAPSGILKMVKGA
jgi:hypothetical protein